MSHRNQEGIVNVRLDEKRYDLLWYLAKMWKMSPEEIASRVLSQALDNAAKNLMDKVKEDA